MVVVFGSVNLDLVARVARMPQPGETLPGRSFAMHAGGKGANQALAARRAGAEVMLVGAVGSDPFADLALEHLRGSGVGLRVVTSATPTGVALINVDFDGHNAITVVPGANAEARAEQLAEVALGPATTLVLQLELPVEEVAAAARRGRERRARVVLNAAPLVAVPAGLLHDVDVLIVNETEAAALAEVHRWPAETPAFARAARDACGSTVVVTLGAEGAFALGPGGPVQWQSPHVPVVDTTGAGDALVGALAAALDRSAPLEQALREGVAAGALACTREGAQSALPDRAAIVALAAQVQS